MAIRKPIPLEWKKKKHRLVITMLIIERVNTEIGIMNLTKFDPKNFDFVKISKFYYILFDECGFNVKWLDVYDVIFAANDKEKASLIQEYGETVKQFLPNFNTPTAKKKTKQPKKSKP